MFALENQSALHGTLWLRVTNRPMRSHWNVINSLSYDRWRTHDPESSLRFFGVRLHEAGLIKTSPETLIKKGTDWRFLNELKKELKA